MKENEKDVFVSKFHDYFYTLPSLVPWFGVTFQEL